MSRVWPGLILRANVVDQCDEIISGVLADFNPVAIHDLAERPLPPGGLWDPTYPPIPDPPPTPLHWNVCFSDGGERERAADAIRSLVPGLSIEAIDLPDEDWGGAVAAVIDRRSRRPVYHCAAVGSSAGTG